jgi:hypothetical protein
MFNLTIDDRLSSWSKFRADLDHSTQPLEDVWEFWKQAPYVPYNNKIDPYYQDSWPSPWEIIVDNRYDDFTKTLMIGWTLKLSNRYKNNAIEIKTYLDKIKNSIYNVVSIDNLWLINYSDNGPVKMENLPESMSLQNFIQLKTPR